MRQRKKLLKNQRVPEYYDNGCRFQKWHSCMGHGVFFQQKLFCFNRIFLVKNDDIRKKINKSKKLKKIKHMSTFIGHYKAPKRN